MMFRVRGVSIVLLRSVNSFETLGRVNVRQYACGADLGGGQMFAIMTCNNEG